MTNVLRALLLCLPAAAFAGGTATGTLSQVIVRQSDGLTYVFVNAVATGQPACAQTGPGYWIVSAETTDAGHKLYALLLAAKLSGSTVLITGDGSCSRWSDGESILMVQLLN